MDKEDYIWVAIRVFGIFLIVEAIIAIPEFIASLSRGVQFTAPQYVPKSDKDSYMLGL